MLSILFFTHLQTNLNNLTHYLNLARCASKTFHILLTSDRLSSNYTPPTTTSKSTKLAPLPILKTNPSLSATTSQMNFMPTIYGKHHCQAVHYY